MIFVIAAIFILVISFVVALVSLVREQSKIEKENVGSGKNQSQPEIETPQAANEHAPQPDLTNIGTTQSQAPSQPQPQPPPQIQTQAQEEDLSAVHLAQKPWWEKEIQKSGEQPLGSTIDWQDTGQPQVMPADVSKTEESGKVLEAQDSLGTSTPRKKDRNLHGSFSLSDLKGADQES